MNKLLICTLPITGPALAQPRLSVSLAPTVTYSIYPFQQFHEGADIGNTLLGSTGEPMQQLWMGIGARLHDPSDDSIMVPFVEVTGGYELERVGKVSVQWQEREGTVYSTDCRRTIISVACQWRGQQLCPGRLRGVQYVLPL